MYRLIFDNLADKMSGVLALTTGAFIPFDPANTDFQKFKADLAEGVELQDPEGAPMTPAAVAEFIKSLP